VDSSPLDFDWRKALREVRRARQLSQQELGRRAGLSAGTVRAYENGTRHPTEGALSSVIDALGIPREDANRIRASAGYAVDWKGLLRGRYSSPDTLAADVELYPWPVFITNQAIDVLYTNRPFQAVWDVDLEHEYLEEGQRNLLAGASDPRFAGCIANYDEVVSFMIGLAKGDPRGSQNPERPTPWLQSAFQRFLAGDPALIKRFFELWEKAPALPHSTRHFYPVSWLYRGSLEMRFVGVLTVVDIWNELSWNDWVPANADTWAALERLGANRS
jgi:transcriptional regulator with XRE-family HTH domain